MTEDELFMAHGVDPSRIHRSGSASRLVRDLLVEREGGPIVPCRRCGRGVDTRLSGKDPWGPQVGHIVPVSRGGSDSLDNLAIEHKRCNQFAGDRLDSPIARIATPIER